MMVTKYFSFNHRVVTLVMRGFFGMETKSHKAAPEADSSSPYNHNTLTTLRTSMKESLQMHLKIAVRNFHGPDASR